MLADHKYCDVCSSNCLTCTGTSTYCTSCSSPLFLDLETTITSANHVCVNPCPMYYYGDTSSQKCESCHAYCKYCTAPYND